ncbi:uncharacterized protein LOC111900218 [Lactuca sativa]|uniref:uncharacterized protein LOC111900218 n=1 Tax=Lactuca sativa TaxID=4236 RepID=UPI000CD8B958|nr:uncharacterized protein LOC111900218 [Lactuca sativa]
MKRKEIQRKLHDSLINMLYTPPSPPPHENKYDQQTHDLAREIANSDHHRINTDELEREAETNFSVSSEEDDELGSEKLTRAQRKRLRRKKLKEAASHRRQIIGPELPPTGDDQINDEVSNVHQQSEGVRRNVTERSESGNNREDAVSSIKVKHRRMSKKKARGQPKDTSIDPSHETTSPGD